MQVKGRIQGGGVGGGVGQIQIFQTPEIAITFRIVDGHTEFPHCMLLFDKSN
jgi:hypothetical protein